MRIGDGSNLSEKPTPPFEVPHTHVCAAFGETGVWGSQSGIPKKRTLRKEGWIVADPFRGGVRVLITGPQGFERSVVFAIDEDAVVIAQQVRETIDE